jgi:hypothetical protein
MAGTGAVRARLDSSIREVNPALNVAKALARSASAIECWSFETTSQERAIQAAAAHIRSASRLLTAAFDDSPESGR